MSRLYDAFMTMPRIVTFRPSGRPTLNFQEAIRSVPVAIDVGNVAELIFNSEDEYPDWDYPNVAPPWPLAFFEYRVPRESLRVTGALGGIRTGFLVAAFDLERATPEFKARLSPSLGVIDARWFMWVEQIVQMRNGTIIHTYDLGLLVSADGSLSRDERGVLIETSNPLVAEAVESGGLPREFDPLLMAISLSHCKNVEMRAVDPDPKRLRSARKRGHPLHRYYVLEIDPMRKVLREEGRSDEVGLPRALHICRGHFKDYRERGLFGSEKHRGVYWWPQTLKGSPRSGTVTKDYAVTAPQGESE